MLKKCIAIILCVFLMLGLCACGEKAENSDGTETGNQQSGGEVPNKDGSPSDSGETTIDLSDAGVIICYGDSITEGMAMDKSHTYPSVLQSKLGEQIKVINAGVGGETSNTIMSRANAVEFTVTNNIVFSAGQDEAELDWKLFSTMDGGVIKYRYGKLGNQLSTANVKIDGKAYTMRYQNENGNDESEGKYILSRSDSSSALIIKKGAKVEFDYSSQYDKCYCAILLMGANDGNLSVDELIARYKKIAATSDKFIAIIPHYGADYTKEFTDAFGNATVNLREYCKEEVWGKYNITKEKKDEYYIGEGLLPSRFVYQGKKGDCHLSQLGYEILADLVYKKGVELDYWK